MRTARALAIALGLCLAGPSALAQGLPWTTNPEAMEGAIAEALSHIDIVLSQLVDDRRKIHPALNLKIKLPVQHLEVREELVWVESLSLEDGRFAGQLANAPAYLKGTRLGDTVHFDREQIADWSVLDTSGRMYGHYTTRVLMQALPEDQKAPLLDLLMPDPMPEAWR